MPNVPFSNRSSSFAPSPRKSLDSGDAVAELTTVPGLGAQAPDGS